VSTCRLPKWRAPHLPAFAPESKMHPGDIGDVVEFSSLEEIGLLILGINMATRASQLLGCAF